MISRYLYLFRNALDKQWDDLSRFDIKEKKDTVKWPCTDTIGFSCRTNMCLHYCLCRSLSNKAAVSAPTSDACVMGVHAVVMMWV